MSLLLALQGDGGITGTLAATEAQDVAAFTAQVLVQGALATTEAQDIAAFTAQVIVSGALATSEAQDTAAFTGDVIVSGVLDATEAQDVATFEASVSGGVVEAPAASGGGGGGAVRRRRVRPTFRIEQVKPKPIHGWLEATEAQDTAEIRVVVSDVPKIVPFEFAKEHTYVIDALAAKRARIKRINNLIIRIAA